MMGNKMDVEIERNGQNKKMGKPHLPNINTKSKPPSAFGPVPSF